MFESALVSVPCPVCPGAVPIPRPPANGDWFVCPRCGADLEVVSCGPIRLEESAVIEETRTEHAA